VAQRSGSKRVRRSRPLGFEGRELDAAQLARIQELARGHRGGTRGDLAAAACRDLGWRRPNGELRLRACRDVLVRLAEAGEIEMPRSRLRAQRRAREPAREAAPDVAADTSKAQDVALRRIVVRPIDQAELPRWREAMERHHYLGDGEIVGETLRHVAEIEGRWLALLGWGAAALKSRHREAWVGWDEQIKHQRLHLVANNVRFLIVPSARVPHLASAVLARSVRRLSADWQARYGHPVLLAETFVDVERFAGTCYRAANWVHLGETRGMARKGKGYEAHGRKKALFVYALHPRAREVLAAPFPSPEILRRSSMPALSVDVNKLPLDGEGGLVEVLREMVDPRKRRGIRHPLENVLAMAVMACLSGMRSYEAIAEWAKDLPQDVLKRMKCWCWKAPSEPTFRRVLQMVDPDEVDRRVSAWLVALAERGAISLDGKTLRGSADGEKPAMHLLSAITHGQGVVVAQLQVGEKSNEIPGAKPLLAELDLKGVTVTADAMHTQTDLAHHLVENRGADYVLIVKDNQPTLHADIASLEWEALPPSGHDARQGARPDRETHDPAQH
jgi:hypothetical protein